MDLNTIRHPSRIKKIKCSFLDYIQLLMIGRAGRWTLTPSATPLQSKKWNAHFWITFQLLMIGQAGRWTLTPSATPLQSKKWNACFWIMFNFWWSARLVDGLKPRPPPLSSQKYKMLVFALHPTSDDWLGWLMDSNPIATPLQPKELNAHFWIMFNFWWLAGLVDGLEHHPPPLSNQKN